MFDLKYISNQEKIKTRKLSKILREQKSILIDMLEKEEKGAKDIASRFVTKVKDGVPEYLMRVLPTIMTRGAQQTQMDFTNLLPDNYSLGFDLETSPASNYLRNLEELHLSQRQGSISKTTNDEVRNLIADGIDEGLSYSQIAERIRTTDPFVFSKSRAELIAVQEIGQAYGFGSWQPIEDMMQTGLVFEKLWVTSHDVGVRETHKENEALGWIPATQEWTATGDMFAPSHEFRCRCYQKNRLIR